MSMRRLTLMDTSRRRSPSTLYSRSMMSRTRAVSSSVQALTRLPGSTRASAKIFLEDGMPIPYMYWIAISPRLSRGRSTPEIRAMWSPLYPWLTLALLVARVLADDAHDALAPHDLAVLAPDFDGRSDFHSGLT